MNGHIAASIFPGAAELCDFIYLPEDAHEHSRTQKLNGMRYQNDPWVLESPPDFQVHDTPEAGYSAEME